MYSDWIIGKDPESLAGVDGLNDTETLGIGECGTLVVLAGEHTQILKENNWSKKQVKQYLYDHAKRTIADLKKAARLPGDLQPEDENTWRHAVRDPEDILVVCAGGAVGNFSACLLGWSSYKSTRPITTII